MKNLRSEWSFVFKIGNIYHINKYVTLGPPELMALREGSYKLKWKLPKKRIALFELIE